jgi:hypothetical protein
MTLIKKMLLLAPRHGIPNPSRRYKFALTIVLGEGGEETAPLNMRHHNAADERGLTRIRTKAKTFNRRDAKAQRKQRNRDIGSSPTSRDIAVIGFSSVF